jgi:succinyl-CoA synthetase beta subunit
VRLDGTNAKEAADILNNAGISNIIAATDLADGARKAVAAAKGE